MKKSLTRFPALLASLALLIGVCAMPASAADTLSGEATTTIVNADPTPAPTPAPTATAAPTAAPSAAPSATPSGSASPSATPEPEINNASVYVIAATLTDSAGGEITTVGWNDTFNVVLRVLDHSSAQFDVTADQISARINSSVFQYTGNGEISQLVEGEDGNGAYYSYILLFRDVKYIGGGNSLPINLSYLDATLPMQQFSVTLGQCLDKDPADPSKIKSPNLVLRQSSYGNADVVAGKPFTLSLTVYASTGTEAVNDVVVSVTLPEHITLTGGSLSSYIGAISPRGTQEVGFSILPSASITASVANITVNMSGTGAVTGAAVSGSSIISVPILQPDRFELQNIEVPESMMVGQGGSVSLSFVNKGKNPLSNLEATLTGTNLGTASTKQYVGNVAAGSENSVDFDLMPDTAGPISGVITLSYEGTDGSVQTVSKDFTSTAEDAMPFDPGMDGEMPVEEPKTGMPVWGWLLIVAGGAVVLLAVVLFIRKKRKAAAISKLEDSDEDL